jgi:iron(III) transport system substrate-binding protein
MCLLVTASALLAGLGCQRNVREVVVYTSIDQVFSEPILKDFERETGIRVRPVFDTEETKSTGVLNRLIAERGSPQADVFWSGDPVRPFVLIRQGLVTPYTSTEAAKIPLAFKDRDGRWTGGAARVRVLLVNKNLVSAEERPRSLKDFLLAALEGSSGHRQPCLRNDHDASRLALRGVGEGFRPRFHDGDEGQRGPGCQLEWGGQATGVER